MDGWQFLRDLHDWLFGWLGWPTFIDESVLQCQVELRDEHLKNADETIRGILATKNHFETEARHLGVLNKALAKIGNRHAQRIRELEADLGEQRRQFADLQEEFEKRFR